MRSPPKRNRKKHRNSRARVTTAPVSTHGGGHEQGVLLLQGRVLSPRPGGGGGFEMDLENLMPSERNQMPKATYVSDSIYVKCKQGAGVCGCRVPCGGDDRDGAHVAAACTVNAPSATRLHAPKL